MNVRSGWILILVLGLVLVPTRTPLPAQSPPSAPADGAQWRSVPGSRSDIAHTTPYTEGMEVLPNTAGQVWRNYDIGPFSRKFEVGEHPQQQIVDWILRETGTDIWFGEPLAILSATGDTLRVYHTPEVQEVVHDIVDRFTNTAADDQVTTFRLVTISSPNWRSRAFPVLQPVTVTTPGIQAWLISKENAAILLGELRKRNDFVEHHAPTTMIANGTTKSLKRTQPTGYARSLLRDANGWLLPTVDMARFEEGFWLEISPLQSLDGSATEVVIRCAVDQIEKLQPVNIDIPSLSGNSQRVEIEIPQVASWRLHERFRWPADQVLLLSCGVVATPGPDKNRLVSLPKFLNQSSPRADALLFIENRMASDPDFFQGGSRSVAETGSR